MQVVAELLALLRRCQGDSRVVIPTLKTLHLLFTHAALDNLSSSR